MAHEDDVPPLEDMSEAFSTCMKIRDEKKREQQNVTTKREVLTVTEDSESQRLKRIEKLLGKEQPCTVPKPNAPAPDSKPKETKKEKETFGGFKKGFFDSPKQSSKKMTVKKESIPTISKKVDEKKNVLPEVQDAVKQQIPLLDSKQWMTEELLSKIMAHPKLSKQFTDPRFSEVIGKLQSNPEEVMRASASNPEMREFIQNFCAIMGDHFTQLGEKQSSQEKAQSAGNAGGMTPADQKKMEAILSDNEISQILKSPDVQMFFRNLKEDPVKAQRMLKTADSAFRYKIQKLVDVGLLQMAV